ncbi:hypothetical protein EC844_12266 [Acinetobacter calcoaceticus]|uniref:DUF3298 domain-containing protein n=1 Tax=Acinetobacter calcoaceticus TaxID=471 RepID=A0A4R1XH20_ACICA|nr:hypothetical protein EC844_12266 [Acinetobacter calcoaceticus]
MQSRLGRSLFKISLFKIGLLSACIGLLSGCDSASDSAQSAAAQTQNNAENTTSANPDILPYLDIKTTVAVFKLPPCTTNLCTQIDILSVESQDPWLNQWITHYQAQVLQRQIGLIPDPSKPLNLQQAVDAYVKKSQAWQKEFVKNKPYELQLSSQIATQRNQYVLLQLSVDSQQGDLNVKQRQYFAVADRKLQKTLSILDVIKADQQAAVDQWVQAAYQKWLQQQSRAVQQVAAKSLQWQQADWFFDHEGIGLHFRANEISPDGTPLAVFLTPAQTQQALHAEAFKGMF